MPQWQDLYFYTGRIGIFLWAHAANVGRNDFTPTGFFRCTDADFAAMSHDLAKIALRNPKDFGEIAQRTARRELKPLEEQLKSYLSRKETLESA